MLHGFVCVVLESWCKGFSCKSVRVLVVYAIRLCTGGGGKKTCWVFVGTVLSGKAGVVLVSGLYNEVLVLVRGVLLRLCVCTFSVFRLFLIARAGGSLLYLLWYCSSVIVCL